MTTIDWAALIREGDQIVCSHMTSEPVALLKSLGDAGLECSFGVTLGVPFSVAAAALPSGTVLTTFGGMGSAGTLGSSHRLRISPVPYSRCGDVYRQRIERCDVALVSLARAPDGRLMLGASHGYIIEAARQARAVVAEINSLAPSLEGAEWPADIALDRAIETAYLPSLAAELAATAIELRLARVVAELVPDGACLQVGIGAMPSAVLAALEGHRHLGIHTGMLTDAMHRLVVSGVVDHSRKPVGCRFAVVGSVYGSAALYRASHGDRSLMLCEPARTHDPVAIAALPDFVAINSAIEVDLLGQVNAESVRTAEGTLRWVGGVGGLGDFLRAAPLAPRGQAIVALPSRTRAGAGGRARIVSRLSGPATVAASDADIVATEHGVARLRDRSIDHRVRCMIAIADPADRETLEQEARSMGYLDP